MNDFDVVGRIKELCELRSWTYYRLAKEAGIPYSSLSTMLHKTYVPSVPSLMKICEGFGITLAEFFGSEDENTEASIQKHKWLTMWEELDQHGRELASAYIQGLMDRQKKSD